MKITNLTAIDIETLNNIVANAMIQYGEAKQKTGLDKFYFVRLLDLRKKLLYILEENKND